MNEIILLVLAFGAGALLGIVFFGGLWFTVLNGVRSKNPALWFLGSMLLRTAIVLLGFYFVADGQLSRLFACLIGFIIARIIIMRFTKASIAKQQTSIKESGHDH